MRILYDLGLWLYAKLIHLFANGNAKARLWVEGRANWRENLRFQAQVLDNAPVLWMHVASLGEFEQGRPVLEAFRLHYPNWKLVLSFFSPSGYEIRKNYPGVDLICYLPLDTARNARDFLGIIHPQMVIFVKYEFWRHYLSQLKKQEIHTILISAAFRPNQVFFAWYGGFWRSMLHCFNSIFVQNEASALLLQKVDFQNVIIAGDTRIDRVLDIAAGAPRQSLIAKWAEGQPVLIFGSSWKADEQVYLPVLEEPFCRDFKIMVAPHQPDAKEMLVLEEKLGKIGACVRFSNLNEGTAAAQCLIIDNMGMLNQLYRYGWVAYIGGGFGKSIHNILEPAAWGLPVIFGPKHQKFEEAIQLMACGGAYSIQSSSDFRNILQKLTNLEARKKSSEAIYTWLSSNQGATRKIMIYFSEIIDKTA
ncbi:MAG: 3-deoxy-D-manno-octulosonic acid transferase [Bacteroidetes bacterium]|nr:3-deoxy-D-manno-octulosonic acid transferase [Bacteroidota bacterium]